MKHVHMCLPWVMRLTVCWSWVRIQAAISFVFSTFFKAFCSVETWSSGKRGFRPQWTWFSTRKLRTGKNLNRNLPPKKRTFIRLRRRLSHRTSIRLVRIKWKGRKSVSRPEVLPKTIQPQHKYFYVWFLAALQVLLIHLWSQLILPRSLLSLQMCY